MQTNQRFDDSRSNHRSGSSGLDEGFSNEHNRFSSSIPEVVKQFVTYLQRHIKENSVVEIHAMYENSFNKITEKYYKQSSWPPVEAISSLVGTDPLFLVLYKELYFRHIYAKMIPTLEQRLDSWKNYCEFFNLVLDSSNLDLNLPGQWLWDIIDEFIYQFQSFCQYRAKLKNRPKEELSLLQNNPQAWNVNSVINFLQSLINKSKTIHGDKESSIYRVLGYFSIIGLCRIHCLLGDYYLALKTIAPIELTAHKGLFTQVIACHITLYYYMGFIYMMMRRYADAIRTFSSILLYISRTKQYHTRSYQYDQISKKNEQMYGLLAICLSLSPQRVDENVHTLLREKYSDKMLKMQRGDEATFEELFSYACPKFVTPSSPNINLLLQESGNTQANNQQEALKVQTKLFLQEVKQQTLVPTIRSYLKLYTTIPTQKLSDFLDLDQKSFRTQLLCYKHKTRGLVWVGGPPLNGEWTFSSDVDFYLDKDMVHITDTKVQRRYSEFFIRHIHKFDEIIGDVSKDK